MKRRALFALFILVASVSFLFGEEGKMPMVNASDKTALAKVIDQEVIVFGKVESAAWSTSGKVLRIRFAKADEANFGAVAFEKQKKKLDESFGGDFIKAITGADIRIVGTVKKYGGKDDKQNDQLEVVIAQPSQVTIVEKQ